MTLHVLITNDLGDTYCAATASKDGRGLWMLTDDDDSVSPAVRIDQMFDDAAEWEREER